MTQDEANTRAKELYGPKAFVKINHFKACDILIDQSWNEGKKRHEIAQVAGWGKTWEEAFEYARRNRFIKQPESAALRQLELFK